MAVYRKRGVDKMSRGFTLLELIIVIVILGIMATLAATQYTKMVEKSRGAEARVALGSIRTNEAAMRLQNSACSSTATDAGVGVDFPSACTTTHYFSYSLIAAASNTFTARATRCTGSGKTPNYTGTAGTLTLTTNFDNGQDSWTATSPY
jgi:prepilin-type N-terminal cleavage/methylation domain-containing protein